MKRRLHAEDARAGRLVQIQAARIVARAARGTARSSPARHVGQPERVAAVAADWDRARSAAADRPAARSRRCRSGGPLAEGDRPAERVDRDQDERRGRDHGDRRTLRPGRSAALRSPSRARPATCLDRSIDRRAATRRNVQVSAHRRRDEQRRAGAEERRRSDRCRSRRRPATKSDGRDRRCNRDGDARRSTTRRLRRAAGDASASRYPRPAGCAPKCATSPRSVHQMHTIAATSRADRAGGERRRRDVQRQRRRADGARPPRPQAGHHQPRRSRRAPATPMTAARRPRAADLPPANSRRTRGRA